jgi:ADP-ribose pyrophosphatase YjhB (NUDIX family)
VIKAGEVLEVFDRIIPGADGRTQYHYVLVDFLCQVVRGDLRAGEDAAEVAWAGLDELEKYELEEPAMSVIRKGLEKNL